MPGFGDRLRKLRKASELTQEELAGHSEISMTMRYTHINIDDKSDAVRLLD